MATFTELDGLTKKQKQMVMIALRIRKESCQENNETKEAKEWQEIIDILGNGNQKG